MVKSSIEITKEMLFYIMDQLHEAIHIVDKDGIVIYANNAAETLERLPKEDMIGKHITSIYTHINYEEGELPPCLSVLKTGIPRLYENSEYYSKDGQKVYSIVSNYPYSAFSTETPKAAFAVSVNINKMKELLITLGGVSHRHTYRLQKKLMTNGTVYVFDDIIGESPAMKSVIEMAKRFAVKRTPVMIYGETGTGKELFAQSIHNASEAVNNNFVPINCAAIPENLIESILFGTVKGAFTGALDKEGLFEKAQGGTIFLDEINSMPITLQAKLLRVLQEKEVQRIGDNRTIKINCRVISATNQIPSDAIKDGTLRADLFYRLSTGIIFIPPLRERNGDLSLLTRYFVENCNEDFGNYIFQVSDELNQLLSSYSWPGNIRELANTIESAMNMTAPEDVMLTSKHLPTYLKARLEQENLQMPSSTENSFFVQDFLPVDEGTWALKQRMDAFEKYIIEKALQQNNGNILITSAALSITRQGLEKKIKKYGINHKIYRSPSL